MGFPEQIEGDMWLRCDRRWVKSERRKVRVRPSGARRFLKRLSARLQRRLARRLLDDAPAKPRFKGYEY